MRWCYSCDDYFNDFYDECCPRCGSSRTDEASKCDICGEPIPPGEGLCKWCREEVQTIAKDFLESLKKRAEEYNQNYDELLLYVSEEVAK